ncbi:MAG: Fic family protein [Bacteroidales bacterium]|nr:Fic family protein [Bacteroidales bacterium]
MIESPPKLEKKDLPKAYSALDDINYKPLLSKINNEYQYWDKVKYISSSDNIDSQTLWHSTKIQRRLNYKQLKFGKYTFNYYITDKMQELLHEFDLNFGLSLQAKNIIPEKDKQYYLLSSIMEEAIASSQMEGASTTRKVAKEMLRKQDKPKNKGQRMIANNYATITFLLDHKKDELSIEKLLEIHKLISSETIDNIDEEGKIRDNDNIFLVNEKESEIAYTPPTHTELNTLLIDLIKFFNKEDEENFIHPIVKGIIIHFMLSYIHPFSDGNGRTARSLFYLYLMKRGYFLTEYLSISRIIYKSKAKYEKAFLYTEHDENDLSYFLHYNLIVMKKAYEELKSYLERKINERNNTIIYNTIPEINERQATILKIYTDNPNTILTIKELENRFGVSNQTARIDITTLVTKGFVKEIALNKRKTGYIRSENFISEIEKHNKK